MGNIEIPKSIKEKREKLNLLKDKLAELIFRKDHLLFTKKKNLEALYTLKIGKHEYELLETECMEARLKRKIELMQLKINKGLKIDLEKIENILDKEYKKWEEEIKKKVDEVMEADNRLKSLLSEEDSKKLRDIYRKLVKILHPDINKDISGREKILWQRLQDAYKNGDLEEIKLIEMLAEKEGGIEEKVKDLDNIIRDYEKKISKLSDEIIEILSGFPFDIEENLKDKNWIKDRVEEYKGKIREKKEHIKNLKQVIDDIILKNLNIENKEIKS